ncbi:efflux RND transporter permease subunit [Teredinibacter haidensis]|uniref:efflux RND transporter permease subunit n=1 Tax=Teredinibacter haidensis TaxID=2731755 RepID=UPI000948EA17|nr:efflux RND transporter permease subunit [Teredinibacter haidensis]
MKLTEYTITRPTISWMVVVLLIGGGILSFLDLGRLEDPAFTIKQAVIVTRYPGASALEVEEEVTLPIENAIQQLPYVDDIVSVSTAGLSQVEVEMKSYYRKDDLAQIWDEMRRKIRDMEAQLPPGVSAPIINDDFSDVYGSFYAVTGEGFSYEEIADYTDYLRRELVLVEGVGKVIVSGRLNEQVFIEVDKAKLSASGFSLSTIQQLLQSRSIVADAGHLQIGSEYLRIEPKALGNGVESSLAGLLLGSAEGKLVYLGDVANISKGYQDPASHIYRFNGHQALALGVSFASGVNVVEVGKLLDERLLQLESRRPLGMDVTAIYNQPAQVETSVSSFVEGLVQAVVIVIVVLMFTMGWRPGVIMSAILLLSISGTFIVMRMFDIDLHRISLGALIIALGMLVDNAIVVVEGIMISIQRGASRMTAAIKIVSHNQLPLLGATVIAVTAFAPIGLSPDASGEFTGSLFWVLCISLMISWVLAVTLTPFFCYLLFSDNDTAAKGEEIRDPYRGVFYGTYRAVLHFCLHYRGLAGLGLVALLVLAVLAFGNVRQAFFPDSSLPLLQVDYWLPEGTSIHQTEAELEQLDQYILQQEEVKQVTASIGRGAERFMLTYAPEKAYPSFGQLLVEAKSFELVPALREKIEEYIRQNNPQAFVRYTRPSVGPATAAKIEARLIGPDPQELRALGQQVIALLKENPNTINVRQDWRERAKVLQPVFDSAAARRLGIGQADLNNAIKYSVNGQPIGVIRNGSDILPVLVRPPIHEREGIAQLEQIQIHSPLSNSYVNIGQFVQSVEVIWDDPIIKRRDRKRTLAVLADPDAMTSAADLHAAIRGPIEALELPEGYELEWGGEYEAQQMANKAVFAFLPLGVLVMIIINVLMFNSVKQTLVIWLTVPLVIVGVSFGLLVTDSPFSFTALLAVLSLIGMQIKNGIVLVEEIKRQNEEEGENWHDAISHAAVSRLRPVTMAAVTTILGMIPLLTDVFFQPMAVTIMAGLGFATILTLIGVPVLFALLYGVKE